MSKLRVLVPAALVTVMALAACVPPPTPPSGGSTVPTSAGGTTAPTAPTTTTTTIVPGPPHLYSENPHNGWSHNGTAYAVDIAGHNVYVGGEFSRATKGNQFQLRDNVMAVARSTGELLPGFVANTNGTVYAVISDGSSVWIGGDFTTVNGVARSRLAKVDAFTGAVDQAFTATAPNTVKDLLLAGNQLYVVGEFGQINGVQRDRAALLDKATGAVDPTFDPNVPGLVNTVALNPNGNRLYLGLQAPKDTPPYLVEVNAVTGGSQGPNFSVLGAYVRDVTVGPDGTIYVAVGGGMNSAFALDPNNGRQRWRQRAEGDVQAVKVSNGYVFFGFHDSFTVNGVRDYSLRILAANPATGALAPNFMPATGSYPGVLTIDADGDFLAVGGLFGRMGGRSVNGLSIHP
ncbi:MAG TPA: PQQ-binding-like beta-propeller repeat protein [Acidimicrobiales bacterium]|nr:PQQ-binding-like beta-propeller repeat protein [Acidimicrobiales bacterium]